MYERAKDGEPLSVTVFGVTSLQHRAQLLVDLCLELKMSKRDCEIQSRVCMYGCGCTVGQAGWVGGWGWGGVGGCRASGLCKRKATVQFSQAAVVSDPPMRRSTVAMWTCVSVRTWRHRQWHQGL